MSSSSPHARPRVPGIRPARALALALALGAAGCAPSAAGTAQTPAGAPGAAGAPTVQPGAPGEEPRVVEPGGLGELGGVDHTEADVRFMRGMIHHHAQALDMTSLLPGRTNNDDLRRLALRIDISQRDEIALMERWLEDRGEAVPEREPAAEAGAHGGHGGQGPAPERPMMPGMLTPEQMERLAAARGREFDRLFLEYMIQHHRGALVMVDELFSSAGGGEESEIFQFASHVDADQRAEIQRLQAMLDALR